MAAHSGPMLLGRCGCDRLPGRRALRVFAEELRAALAEASGGEPSVAWVRLRGWRPRGDAVVRCGGRLFRGELLPLSRGASLEALVRGPGGDVEGSVVAAWVGDCGEARRLYWRLARRGAAAFIALSDSRLECVFPPGPPLPERVARPGPPVVGVWGAEARELLRGLPCVGGVEASAWEGPLTLPIIASVGREARVLAVAGYDYWRGGEGEALARLEAVLGLATRGASVALVPGTIYGEPLGTTLYWGYGFRVLAEALGATSIDAVVLAGGGWRGDLLAAELLGRRLEPLGAAGGALFLSVAGFAAAEAPPGSLAEAYATAERGLNGGAARAAGEAYLRGLLARAASAPWAMYTRRSLYRVLRLVERGEADAWRMASRVLASVSGLVQLGLELRGNAGSLAQELLGGGGGDVVAWWGWGQVLGEAATGGFMRLVDERQASRIDSVAEDVFTVLYSGGR